MKKILLLIVMTGICCAVWAQGFYGDVLKSENFDNEATFTTFWTTVNATPDDNVTLKFANPTSGNFSLIEPSNITSGHVGLKKGNKPLLITTSNDISLEGKSDIVVGFYAKSLGSLFKIFFKVEVSHNAGATWTNIFNSETDSNTGTEIGNSWRLYKCFLPTKYDGENLKVRFIVDGTTYAGSASVDIYFDNLFVSERYSVDPIIKGINYSLKNTTPTKKGFSAAEPITIDFTNGGKTPITSITLKYQINEGKIVSEVYTPTSSITTNNAGQYTFNQKANLSELRQSYTIKAWSEMDGDSDINNNHILGYAENITTGLPYTPQFLWTENGMAKTGPDEWKSIKKGSGPQWTINSAFGVAYWGIKKGVANADTYLITRPIHFEAGKTYEIRFDALTNSNTTELDKFNNLKIYASDNTELINMKEIYSKNGIDNTNAINQFARHLATTTGPQYFVFYCDSPLTADDFRLQNIYFTSCNDFDAGISALVSPESNKFEYTEMETVTVKVRNFGTSTIAANAITVKMQLLDGVVTTEKVSQALAAGTELDHSFATKINPSDQSIPQILKVWTEFTEDSNAGNDLIEYKLESFVTAAPYLPTTEMELSTRWAIEDKNSDKQTFMVWNDLSFGGPLFRYGGSSSFPALNIETSNEVLSSRPIRMDAGSTYKISLQTKVDKFTMPLRLDLYKIDGTDRTLVKNITNIVVGNTVFRLEEYAFDIDTNGIYEIDFVVETDELINYKIHCGDFRFTKLFNKDISIRESLVSGSQVSCYNKFPIGVLIRNEGTEGINAFTLKATSPKIGAIEKSFAAEIASGETMACYFDEDMTFDGDEDENIAFSVVMEGDNNLNNNNINSIIKHIQPIATPYNCILNTATDYLIVNNNRDNYRFKKFMLGAMLASGVEYIGNADVIADDEIITKCITLGNEKIYSIALSYLVEKPEDIASLDISIYNVASSSKIDIAYLDLINNTLKSELKAYFTVPEDGDYVVRLKTCNKTTSLRLIGNININVETTKPDVEVLSITAPETDKIFTENETVTISFKSVSSPILSSIPFILNVNGVKYYATFKGPLRGGIESTISFENVNLFTPGDYVLMATANVSADATPSNNSFTKTIKSLPIVDLTLVSIDKPKSGALSAKQEIQITVKNSGKGILINIPVQCTISDIDTKSTITGVIPGPLNDGETVQFAFSETANMYEEKTYNISVISTIENDINIDDNIISTSIVCSQDPLDAGVTNIISPIDGLLTTTETVTVKVKNYCTVDLFDVPVQVTIGEQLITGIIGSIPKQQEIDYTFTQTVDLSAYGSHTITAYTTLDNDVDASNDSFSKAVQSYKIDVGIIDILSPVSGDNMGKEYVKIVVKNFGDVAVNNIPVRYKVATMPQKGTISTEIAPGATVEYTIPSSYDFSEYKTYTITAYTEYSEDMDKSNDTLIMQVTNTKKAIDIAITTLLNPVSGDNLTNEEEVTVTLKNLGEIAIKDIPIECNIYGDVTKETVTNTLAIGEELNYTFTKRYDLSEVKRYNIKISVNAVGDNNSANNVIETIVDHHVGIDDIDNNLSVSIYPNPIKEVMNVNGEYIFLQVYDTSGKLILTAKESRQIDVSSLTCGVYTIKIHTVDGTITHKIVK